MSKLICILFILITTFAFAQSTLQNEKLIDQVIHYLDLKNVSAENRAQLIQQKDKADSAGLTAEQRTAAYAELFTTIGKLQQSTAPSKWNTFFSSAAANWYCAEPRPQVKNARSGELEEVIQHGTGKIPVILIPDLSFSAHIFDSFLQRNEKNYKMYAVTLPGMGGTLLPPVFEHRDYSLLRLWKNAEDGILKLINKEHLKGVRILGLQAGAYLAVRLALDHPDKVGGVIVMNGLLYAPMQLDGSVPVTIQRRAEALRMAAPVELFPNPDESCYYNYMKKWAAGYSKDPKEQEFIAHNGAKADPHTAWSYYSELLTTDLSDEMTSFKMPLLVIPSIPDAAAPNAKPGDPLSLSQWQALKLPNLKIVPLKDTRAFATQDNPQLLDQTISEFLKGNNVL